MFFTKVAEDGTILTEYPLHISEVAVALGIDISTVNYYTIPLSLGENLDTNYLYQNGYRMVFVPPIDAWPQEDYEHKVRMPFKTIYNASENRYEAELILEEVPEEERFSVWTAKWESVRARRDNLIYKSIWRVQRYDREIFLGLEPTDNITDLHNYIQALADITEFESPYEIIWPTEP